MALLFVKTMLNITSIVKKFLRAQPWGPIVDSVSVYKRLCNILSVNSA